LVRLPERLSPEVLKRRDRAVLDDVTRGIGQGLTNLEDELDRYCGQTWSSK